MTDIKELAELLDKAATRLYEEGHFDLTFIEDCRKAAANARPAPPPIERAQAYKALAAIAALQGHGPGGQLNPCYADGVAASSIKSTYGKFAGTDDISGIKRWANMTLRSVK